MSEKTRILGMTDHNVRTGFGTVMHHIIEGAVEAGYEGYFLGWGFHADDAYKRSNYILIPSGQDPYGADVFAPLVQNVKPEIVVVQADTRMIMWMPQVLSRMPNKPTIVFYPVIDGNVWDIEGKRTKWPSNWTETLKVADKVVAMTKYGQKILQANGIDADCIYHGVDTSIYKPASKEERAQIRRQVGIGEELFVWGAVFKNMQRKNPEKYLQAYAIFLEKLPKREREKHLLLLHTQPQPTGPGMFDLIQHAIDYGLEPGKNVLFSSMPVPPQNMPLIYKTCDVFLILGGMEGFNLAVIEAMACGLPIIALDSCTHAKLLGGTGLLTKCPTFDGKHRITYGSYNGVEGDIPNPWDVAKQMMKLYKNEALRKELGFKATERAVKTFDWRIIKNQWVELFKSLIVSEEDIPEEWKKLYSETQV